MFISKSCFVQKVFGFVYVFQTTLGKASLSYLIQCTVIITTLL
ncbi:hypothetical protein NEISICOT_01184 [Neisseria sicca ATCC 29256]|uniref:Uncharacterized protein n=1 Tax=Neisseria sicca ATCC 29256 TaxID=547045 RepID=C6M3N7_NEISI|nr:hypothetical protein NEISICOT_01184 [Neisseria sicca ATCC 29256]